MLLYSPPKGIDQKSIYSHIPGYRYMYKHNGFNIRVCHTLSKVNLHCGDILAGEGIGGVTDEKASLTDGPGGDKCKHLMALNKHT